MDASRAEWILKTFPEKAYKLSSLPQFEEALKVIYGSEWRITSSFDQRMLLNCSMCKKSMNNVNAVQDHIQSANHLKNTVWNERQEQPSLIPASTGLAEKLRKISVQPIGVHLVHEFKGNGRPHYRCCLCGSYACEEAMFFHLIGHMHTDKYIVAFCKVPNNVVLPKHRDYYRNFIIKSEGTGIDQMKTILRTYAHPDQAAHRSITSQSCKSWRMPKLLSLSGMLAYTRALVATVPPSLESQSLVARYSVPYKTKIDSKGATALSEVEESLQEIDPELKKVVSPMKEIKLDDEIQNVKEFVEHLELFKKEGTLWFRVWKQKVEECQDPDEKSKLEANFKYLNKAMAVFQKKVTSMISKELINIK